jgi:nicotinamide riboside kinase
MGHYANLATAENNKNTIFDRCALDGLAYSRYFFNKINISVVDIINRMYNMMISKYDIIFYVEPELDLVDDGERSLNRDFFDIIKLNFNDIIKTDNLKVKRVSGSVENRVQYIIDTICEKEQLHLKI